MPGLKKQRQAYDREKGFRAEHIPVRNYQHLALSDRQLKKVWTAYQRMEGPTLIHCSAGIGRTRKAVSYIKRKVENQII
jgi:protein tyrosine phosphatase